MRKRKKGREKEHRRKKGKAGEGSPALGTRELQEFLQYVD